MGLEMDIKETKEVLDLVNESTIFMTKTFIDGIQVKEDFEAVYNKLINDVEFKETARKAFEGINKVPLELKDLSKTEIIDLAFHEVKAVKSILTVILSK